MTYQFTYTLNPSAYTTAFANAMEDESNVNQSGDTGFVAAAFTAWANVADISFVLASDPSTADLVILEGDLAPRFFGDTIYGRTVEYIESSISKRGIVISKANIFDTANPEAFTYLHEIGHALTGLNHINATRDLSIMAAGSASLNGKVLPTGPMILDIQAIHQTYLPNYSYNSGNNSYTLGDGPGTMTIWDGGGTDTINVTGSAAATIDLRGGMNGSDARWSYVGTDYIAIAFDSNDTVNGGVVKIENATGGSGNDSITGNDIANVLTGNGGNDSLVGFKGADTIYGNDGNDTIYAYDSVGGENDTAVNTLYGGNGNDLLVGGAGADTFDGGAGEDTINYGAGNDTISLAYTVDTEDKYDGGVGADQFLIGTSDVIEEDRPVLANGVIHLADDDNHFSINMNVETYATSGFNVDGHYLWAFTYESAFHKYGLRVSSYEDDLYITSYTQGQDLPPFLSGIAVIEDVGKDLNYGADLLTYLYNNNMLDISGFANGDFAVDVGHEVTGTSGNDGLRLNSNITQATGGAGADTFIADNQTYAATITDFSIAQGDKIDITRYDGQVATYAGLNITGATSAVIDLPGTSTITVTNVAASALTIDKILSNTMDYGTGSGIAGGSNADTLAGTIASETLWGNEGNDSVSAGTGSDTVWGYTGNDTLRGSYGQDLIGGDQNDDLLYGDSGNDSVYGGDGVDALYGGDGNDELGGDAGADNLYGDGGNDTIAGGANADAIDGGAGTDTAKYLDSTAGVTVNLSLSTGQSGGEAAGDILSNVENIDGSAFADVLTGDYVANYLRGNGGDDVIVASEGADTLTGDSGFDTLYYSNSSSAVSIDLSLSSAESGGDAAGDVLNGIEAFIGSSYNDSMVGDAGYNYFNGGAGNDSLWGGDGNDGFSGGTGADYINGGAGFDTLDYFNSAAGVYVDLMNNTNSGGDATSDLITGIEYVQGSGYVDTIIGDTGSNLLYGLGGNDFLYAYTGSDGLFGGAGADTFFFHGNQGADAIYDFEGAGAAGGDVISLYQVGSMSFDATFQSKISYDLANSKATITFSAGNAITVFGVTSSFVAGDFYFS